MRGAARGAPKITPPEIQCCDQGATGQGVGLSTTRPCVPRLHGLSHPPAGGTVRPSLATTYQVFDAAERVELLSAAIYKALAQRFAGDPDARALFTRLQEEEVQHATRIRLLAARYRHDSHLLEKVTATTRELELLAAECHAVLDAIVAGTWARDVPEAKRSLAALEDRFRRAHADLIASEAHPEVRRFFEQLARQDEAHERLLVES